MAVARMKTLALTPDGRRYLAIAEGKRLPGSFHLRWLLPLILGTDVRKWVWGSRAALLLLLPAGFLYGLELGWERALFVAAAPLGLAGIWRFNWDHPVLVDPTALALVLWAAVIADYSIWPALALAFVAGGVKEASPAFVAALAWNPVYLLALLVPAMRLLWKQGPDVLDPGNAYILAHPFQAGWDWHKERLDDIGLWLLPWGVLLLGLVDPSPQVLVVVALGYAQCAIATDTVRLYQWAWPALALSAAAVIPVSWLLVAAVVHVFNPWRGGGV